MTTSHHSKILTQIKEKPAKYAKYKKYNIPKERKSGRTAKKCRICGRTSAHINKYGLHFCRHCFRDFAQKIGFKKYD